MTVSGVTIRQLQDDDRDEAVRVINSGAHWYEEIVEDHDPSGIEMTPEEWTVESQRVTWFGAYTDDTLIGVIGLEYVEDVALLRHWYVLPDHQRSGAGSALRAHLEQSAARVDRIIAGTYARNYKARGALERAGYQLSADSQAVLRAYYDIPEERRSSSVTYEKMVADP